MGAAILALAAFDALKGGYDAINANQQRQKAKGQLGAAYRSGMQRLGLEQGDQTLASNASLQSRGVGVGGNVPIMAALGSGQTVPTVTSGTAPTTIGGQQAVDLAKEQAVDRGNLTNQYNQQLNEINAGADNNEIAGIASGASGAAQAFGQAQLASALGSGAGAGAGGLPAGVTQSPTMYSGGPSDAGTAIASASYGGIHPTDPIGHPGSAWHIPALSSGPATADFHV